MPVTITNREAAPTTPRRECARVELEPPLALVRTGSLHMPDTLPLAKLFRRELLDFRVSYSAVGNATFGAREGAHDDLILAVALAVYGLTRPEMKAEPLWL